MSPHQGRNPDPDGGPQALGPGHQLPAAPRLGRLSLSLTGLARAPQAHSHFLGEPPTSSRLLDTNPGGCGFQDRSRQCLDKNPEPAEPPESLKPARGPGLICTSELM